MFISLVVQNENESRNVSKQKNDYIYNNGAMPRKILSTKVVYPQIIPATDSDNPESVWL